MIKLNENNQLKMLNEKNRMKRMKSWEGPSFLYSSDLTGCWEAGILFFFFLASSGCRQSSLLCAVVCCTVLHHRTCRYLVFFVFCFVHMSCPLPATYVESPLRLLRGSTTLQSMLYSIQAPKLTGGLLAPEANIAKY